MEHLAVGICDNCKETGLICDICIGFTKAQFAKVASVILSNYGALRSIPHIHLRGLGCFHCLWEQTLLNVAKDYDLEGLVAVIAGVGNA